MLSKRENRYGERKQDQHGVEAYRLSQIRDTPKCLNLPEVNQQHHQDIDGAVLQGDLHKFDSLRLRGVLLIKYFEHEDLLSKRDQLDDEQGRHEGDFTLRNSPFAELH